MDYDKLDEVNKYVSPDLFNEINLDYNSVKIYKYLYKNGEHEYITQCKRNCFGSLLYFSMKAYENIINTDSIYQFITGNTNCIDDLAICLLSAHLKRNDLVLLLQNKGFDFSVKMYHCNDICKDHKILGHLFYLYTTDPIFNYISKINNEIIKELVINGLKYNEHFNLSNFMSSEIIQIFLDFDFLSGPKDCEQLFIKYLCQDSENIKENIVNQIISKGTSINDLMKNHLKDFIEIFDTDPDKKINLLKKYDFTHFDELLMVLCIYGNIDVLKILLLHGYELNEKCIEILIEKYDTNILKFLVDYKINLSTYNPMIDSDKLLLIDKLEELGLNKDVFNKMLFDNLYRENKSYFMTAKDLSNLSKIGKS
ncbi:ankyrin repeat-containing protein [Moumouvirus maliensis]|nr:ankyrin repeat-containing protein [Moumouvirus maliensis]